MNEPFVPANKNVLEKLRYNCYYAVFKKICSEIKTMQETPQAIQTHTLANGLVILGCPMQNVQSVAFGFMAPAGAAVIRRGCCGAANIISDWIFRGADGKSSRQISDKLDSMGLHRVTRVAGSHITLGAALQAGNLQAALELYAGIIHKPTLDTEQFTLAKQSAIDDVKALDDDPRQKVMLEVREQFYPEPLGRSTTGRLEELEKLTAEQVRGIYTDNFNLSKTIFSVAGNYDFELVCTTLKKLLDETSRNPEKEPRTGRRKEKYRHIKTDGAQVHIGLATGTVTPSDPDYYEARIAISALSGGMSSRLFTEVREKRGLCYAVGARYDGLKQAGGVICYAGTTPEKAQETADVVMAEFSRLKDGITQKELERAAIGLKSSLIMQNESSSHRAGQIAGDYYLLNRVRSVEDIKQRIEKVTTESVADFLQGQNFEDFTIVTIGPKQLTVET